MSIQITKHSESFSTAPQIGVEDVTEIARLGFKTIINNRPDGEGGPDQPASAQIKVAAEKSGLAYFYIPFSPGNMQPEHVVEFSAVYAAAAKPVLGFCRTGNRAATIFKQSQTSTEAVHPPVQNQSSMAWLKGKCVFSQLCS
ncbi:MAG: TIGR01244 family sulfur transferase [Methylotenera sp.]